ncbi:MAG: tyrosine-type recombinase/integrase, partial [Sedimentitalea sp.]|uniref:tyrosine-type recombinase/integrase n=1 Tax=Sedimentitalea sp. TaxID=2048915 RepID=UPI003266B359
MARRIKREFPGVIAYFDRHQKRRYRFRRKGFSPEIHGECGSDDFRRNYERAIRGHRSQEIGATATKRGTINALIVLYYKSPEFVSLSDSTKSTYWREIELLRDEHGHRLVEKMKRTHVVKLLEPLTDRPSARNNRLRMLRLLLNHAVEIGWPSDNPTAAIKKMRTGSQGFHTWTDDELNAFFACHEIGSTAHTAVTLMLYTACSRVDAVQLGWQNVSGSRLRYRRQKTERFSEVVVDIPIHPDLQNVLGALPKSQMTFLQTSNGRSRSANGLGNAMRKWCNAAKLPDCTSHGLRNACATRLAKAGASEREIMAWTGHTSP